MVFFFLRNFNDSLYQYDLEFELRYIVVKRATEYIHININNPEFVYDGRVNLNEIWKRLIKRPLNRTSISIDQIALQRRLIKQ